MHLGIDAREIQDGVHTGIGRPLANFLNYFSKLDNRDHCVLFSARKIPINFGARVKNVVIEERFTQYWDQIQLAQAVKKEGIELFYSPYYKLPLFITCKCVCAVLDLMYLIVPEYRRELTPLTKLYYATIGKKCVEKAGRILTCSEHSKRDIVRIYGIDERKIEIIPLSVAHIYRPEPDKNKIESMKAKYGIIGPYILYLGNFKPHKNVKTIISAFHKIAPEFPELKLVLAGPKTHLYSELIALTQKLGLSERIIFTGKVSESDEPHLLYSGAEIFVIPSLYEGFGLPPAEAMACGVPVVASNTTSIPEVVKDAGLLVDPQDADAIAVAIKRVLSDASLKRTLVEKGLKYAQEYEEDRVAKMNYDFFKRVLNQHEG